MLTSEILVFVFVQSLNAKSASALTKMAKGKFETQVSLEQEQAAKACNMLKGCHVFPTKCYYFAISKEAGGLHNITDLISVELTTALAFLDNLKYVLSGMHKVPLDCEVEQFFVD